MIDLAILKMNAKVVLATFSDQYYFGVYFYLFGRLSLKSDSNKGGISKG